MVASQRETVLVIDANDSERQMYVDLLEGHASHVITASSLGDAADVCHVGSGNSETCFAKTLIRSSGRGSVREVSNDQLPPSASCNRKHDETSGSYSHHSPDTQECGMHRFPFKDRSRVLGS